jgi:hypothetical protein
LFDLALWWKSHSNTIDKFKSCYKKCMKVFLGFAKCNSVTCMLLEIGPPSSNIILHNYCVDFKRNVISSFNCWLENYIVCLVTSRGNSSSLVAVCLLLSVVLL